VAFENEDRLRLVASPEVQRQDRQRSDVDDPCVPQIRQGQRRARRPVRTVAAAHGQTIETHEDRRSERAIDPDENPVDERRTGCVGVAWERPGRVSHAILSGVGVGNPGSIGSAR
jgi:hypothetical protein